MAEAAGLAIAGNIIQFVDLGIKLFKGGRQLYRSTEGASTEALELETVTLALRSYAQALRASKPSQIGLKGDLEDLTRHCEALATELLALLEELKVKDTEHRKWKSFKVAIASIVKQKDVAELEKRLNRLQALTTQSILNDLRSVPSTTIMTRNHTLREFPVNNSLLFLAAFALSESRIWPWRPTRLQNLMTSSLNCRFKLKASASLRSETV